LEDEREKEHFILHMRKERKPQRRARKRGDNGIKDEKRRVFLREQERKEVITRGKRSCIE
jgi:hypothetical protein